MIAFRMVAALFVLLLMSAMAGTISLAAEFSVCGWDADAGLPPGEINDVRNVGDKGSGRQPAQGFKPALMLAGRLIHRKPDPTSPGAFAVANMIEKPAKALPPPIFFGGLDPACLKNKGAVDGERCAGVRTKRRPQSLKPFRGREV